MKSCIFLFLLIGSLCFGDILTPFAENLPKGKSMLQEYVSVTDFYGAYTNSWKKKSISDLISVESIFFARTAPLDWLDLTVFMYAKWNFYKKYTSLLVEDFYVRAAFQICREIKGTFQPSISIGIVEAFPTGNYKNLSPFKAITDAGGEGAYRSIFGLHYLKTVDWIENHPIRWIGYLSYSIAPNVSVRNFHYYGGGFGTKGTIHPYKAVNAIISSEISVSSKVNLSFHILYEYSTKVTFHGENGISLLGLEAVNERPLSHRFSWGGAIGYAVTEKFGIGAELSGSFLGRNIPCYFSGAFLLSYAW
ncbi:MAG: hypothetical protein WCP39_06120 [Chlamydiota bacterium]